MLCGCVCFGWVNILFVKLRLARWPPTCTWEMNVHVAVADDVFCGDYFCDFFSYMVSWVESGIENCVSF